ncbi:hypothetical protein ACFL5O_11955, partial [Myxococcota bacterium]
FRGAGYFVGCRNQIESSFAWLERTRPGGHAHIRGALHNLGHEVACNTLENVLLENGLEPTPERGRHTSWHAFVKSYLGAIAGAEFFAVDVLRGFGLVRYRAFFVIDIATWRVHIAGITDQPSGARMKQIARNLTDCVEGFLVLRKTPGGARGDRARPNSLPAAALLTLGDCGSGTAAASRSQRHCGQLDHLIAPLAATRCPVFATMLDSGR